jgi:hypothetical protein
MIKKLLPAILIIITAAVFAYTTGCENIRQAEYIGRLSGRVVDSNSGAPLWGALVYTIPTSTSVYTDSTGYFKIGGFRFGSSGGSITAIIEYPGYITKQQNVYLKTLDTATYFVFRLRPAK